MSFMICISMHNARMDRKSPNSISDRLADSLLKAGKYMTLIPKMQKDLQNVPMVEDSYTVLFSNRVVRFIPVLSRTRERRKWLKACTRNAGQD